MTPQFASMRCSITSTTKWRSLRQALAGAGSQLPLPIRATQLFLRPEASSAWLGLRLAAFCPHSASHLCLYLCVNSTSAFYLATVAVTQIASNQSTIWSLHSVSERFF